MPTPRALRLFGEPSDQEQERRGSIQFSKHQLSERQFTQCPNLQIADMADTKATAMTIPMRVNLRQLSGTVHSNACPLKGKQPDIAEFCPIWCSLLFTCPNPPQKLDCQSKRHTEYKAQ